MPNTKSAFKRLRQNEKRRMRNRIAKKIIRTYTKRSLKAVGDGNLEQAAADLEWENRNCYWAPPPGIPYGAAQKYCPGDWGYQPPVVVVTCAPRDRDCDGYPDRRRRDRDHDGRRDRDRD